MWNFTDFAPVPQIIFMGFDLTDFAMRLVVLAALAIVTKLILAIIPHAFRDFDDWIDKYYQFDLPKNTHLAIEHILRGLVLVVALAYAFFFLGYSNPLTEVWFQTIALFILARTVIKSAVPFVQGLDSMVSHTYMSRHRRKLFEKAVRYSVYTCLLMGWMYIFGVTELFYAALAGAGFAGIVVGFAAKDTFGNFIAGVTIVLDKPFKIGDAIEVHGILGEVDEIALRSTTIKMFDNKVVTIPNAMLATEPIINYTREKIRRFDVPVGIAYESDIDEAVSAIKKAVSKIDGVVTDEKSIDVLVDKFSDSSVDLTVRFWIDSKKGLLSTRSHAIETIKKALDEADVEIPYPKRVMLNPPKPRKKRAKRKK
jgi:small-conductance mechanosensitive channel